MLFTSSEATVAIGFDFDIGFHQGIGMIEHKADIVDGQSAFDPLLFVIGFYRQQRIGGSGCTAWRSKNLPMILSLINTPNYSKKSLRKNPKKKTSKAKERRKKLNLQHLK